MVNNLREAATILRSVAEEVDKLLMFPENITAKELGEAICWIAALIPEEDPFLPILEGWRIAERKLQQRVPQR